LGRRYLGGSGSAFVAREHFSVEAAIKPIDELLEERYRKFRNIAQFYTTAQ